jgi:DME family drug/metabolite transporter
MTVLTEKGGEPRRAYGVALVLSSAVCFSLAGVLVREIESANEWQVIYWRSGGLVIAVAAVLALRHKRRFFQSFIDVGWVGVIGTLGLALGSVCFIWAMFNTTIANAVFLFGALPFITGFFAWLLFDERLRRESWFIMAAAFGGIVVMVYGGLTGGRWFGNALAAVGIIGYAALVLSLRAGRNVDMMPLLCMGGIIGGGIALAIEGGSPISPHDAVVSLLLGVVSVSFGFMLFTLGARHVRAGELSLLSNFELILGPLLVWFWIAEVPATETLIGGVVIIAAIMAQAVITIRHPADT